MGKHFDTLVDIVKDEMPKVMKKHPNELARWRWLIQNAVKSRHHGSDEQCFVVWHILLDEFFHGVQQLSVRFQYPDLILSEGVMCQITFRSGELKVNIRQRDSDQEGQSNDPEEQGAGQPLDPIGP